MPTHREAEHKPANQLDGDSDTDKLSISNYSVSQVVHKLLLVKRDVTAPLKDLSTNVFFH